MVSLFFKVKAFQWIEQGHSIRLYYRNVRYACADVALGCFSFFSNPYRTCRKWMQKQREPMIHTYGETPLRLFETLMRAAKISQRDVFVEMGCGRGKLCFWAARFIGCKVRGIEWVPSFVRLARGIAKLSGIAVSFEQSSMFDIDLSQTTAAYLYAIHLSEERMQDLAKQFEQMPERAVVISIGEAIYSPQFQIEEIVEARFAWGKTKAFIQRKVQNG